MHLKKRKVWLACLLSLSFIISGCSKNTEATIPISEDGNVHIKVASYNIKNANNGEAIETIASAATLGGGWILSVFKRLIN